MVPQSQIQAAAGTLLAVAASVGAVFVTPALAEADLLLQAAAAGAGAVGLFAIFLAAERGLRWLWYRRILDEWHYVTIARSAQYRDENYGRATFFFNEDGALAYDVKLYSSYEALAENRPPRGEAQSEAIGYNRRRGWLSIFYSVTIYGEAEKMSGTLLLRSEDRGRRQGVWARVVKDGVSSSGLMFIARPDIFRQHLDAWLAEQHEGTVA